MKKLWIKLALLLTCVSVVLTGFPLNLIIHNVTGEQVLASENELTIENLPEEITIS